ncbi:MAG TPA: aldo/keto reductase [Candidatus Kapabacteria bacterium]|nr:aldo/keto reductase [Candidatus Kapabacteria bacterium]
MEYTNLGRTGLVVSRFCLGTMNFGPFTTEQDAFRIMDRALELGINFFDTANVYGQSAGKGATETILGRWFAQGDGRREKVVLATKLYGEMESWPNNAKISALQIRRACEASLKRLQTDYLDLYQMHHIWRKAPWEETWQAFEQLYRDGKIIYVGSSNFAGWHIAKANEAAKRRNFLGLVSEQSIYSLVNRNIELEVIPACEDYGLGLIPWSPLAGGALAGLKREGERVKNPRIQERLKRDRDKFDAFEQLCKQVGEAPADVALAWVLKNPVVTAPIIGPRTLEQLDGSMRALELKLEEDTLAKLDVIFPGPGGAAPEAYAW